MLGVDMLDRVERLRERSPRLISCLAAIGLAIHALLLFLSIPRNSVTFDEYMHLPAGISYWASRAILELSP